MQTTRTLDRSRSDLFGTVLIKPEATASGIHEELLVEFTRYGIQVLCQHEFIATEQQLNTAWADLPRDKHPLEHVVHDLWFRGQPMVFATVSGPHSTTDFVLLVKRILRERFGRSAFENSLHTPDNVNEMNCQLAGFYFKCRHCDRARADIADALPVREAYTAGILLPSGVRDFDFVYNLVRDAWHANDSYFRAPRSVKPYRLNANGGDAKLELRFSPFDLSYDNLVASLIAVTDLSIEQAVPIVFNAMLAPANPLATGAAADLAVLRDALARHGVASSVQP